MKDKLRRRTDAILRLPNISAVVKASLDRPNNSLSLIQSMRYLWQGAVQFILEDLKSKASQAPPFSLQSNQVHRRRWQETHKIRDRRISEEGEETWTNEIIRIEQGYQEGKEG